MRNNPASPGLYVHVPFCRTKCPYCDFYSIARLGAVDEWLKALCREIPLYAGRFAAFDSLYLGGGTPSLLDGRQLSALLDCLHRHFAFGDDTEITIEANPDDLSAEKLTLLRGLGINRLSLGVQSLIEAELRFLRRRHTAVQAEAALEEARAAGFDNIGVDLIFGFEGQTEASWMHTLERALRFAPEHLSCYQMTIEEQTPFGRLQAKGRLRPVGEERERALFLLTARHLEALGYVHYEVSNYARGMAFASRHNQKYWQHVPYLGLGPSAHSFLDGKRWWNVRSLDAYRQALEEGRAPVGGSEVLEPEELRLEELFLGFRTQAGVAQEALEGYTGVAAVLGELERGGLVRRVNGRVQPTCEGFLVADGLPLLFGA